MRIFGAIALMLLAGCGSASLTLGTAPPPAGGGGGATVAPSPAVACPVDFAQALRREVAAVPERLAREGLMREVVWIEDLANMGSLSARERVIEEFQLKTVRLEARGQLERAHAARMRGLMECYRGF